MNTIHEIQTALCDLEAEMVEKGVLTPSARVHVTSSGRFCFYADADAPYGTRPFEGRSYFVKYGGTVVDIIQKARDYIATMPSPEEVVTREYLSKVSTAIDYAHEHSIEDKYVTPLRNVTCAMTENLLEDKT